MRTSSHAPSPRGELVRIGLTGGIGAGKSTVAQRWRTSGLEVIDLDALSRAVLDVPGPGVDEAIAVFGEEVRAPSGTIDRARMAQIVFADPQARTELETIVLTRVEGQVVSAEREAMRRGDRMIAHDSPQLLEKSHDARYAAVVGVLARQQDRIARVVRDRDRTREYVTSIMAAQVTDLERIRRCDILVVNTGSASQLAERADRALAAACALAGLAGPAT